MIFHDYRDLVGRLDFGRATGVDVTFSPDEAWVLREHIRALADPVSHHGVHHVGCADSQISDSGQTP